MTWKKEIICITCPNGCILEVTGSEAKEIAVRGALCKKGEVYARSEMLHPVRLLTTSVMVANGQLPLVSVKTSGPIPKDRIREVMNIARGLHVKAPIRFNQVLMENLLGLGVDLIATREVRDVG